MIDFIDRFVEFWTPIIADGGIFKMFWYFFFLEIPRYLIFDVIVVLIEKIRRNIKSVRVKREDFRIKLFTENPKVSVIVPGKNEGEHIYKLVESLKNQTYKNFELIIIDDGSTDNTYQICTSLYKNGFINKYLRNNISGGKASAANLGLKYATGEYVVHLDADSSLDTNAIEEIILPFFETPNVGAVGGNLKVRNRVNLLTNCQAMEYLTSISIGRMVTSALGIYRIVSGAFGAFRRDYLNLLGGWDIGPGLDGDITVKIRKMGYKIKFAEKSICLTHVPETPKALTKQRLRWARSIIRFRLRKHKDILLPDRHFNVLNFIATFENVFFSVIMDFLWVFYMILLFVNFYDTYIYIILFKILMYSASTAIQLSVNLLISERRNWEKSIYFYIPLMWLYTGYYMRFVRTFAYIREIFGFSSYNDNWNPEKTSKMAKAYGL